MSTVPEQRCGGADKRASRPVGWRDILVPPALVAGLLLVFILLAGITALAAPFFGFSRGGVVTLFQRLQSGFWGNILLTDFFYGVLLIFLLRRTARLDARSLIGKFVVPRASGMAAALIVGAGFAALTVLLITLLASDHLVAFHEALRDRLLQSHSVRQLLALAVTVSLLAPLAEEIYFRNFLLSLLRRKFGLALAALLSAILFALAHFEFVDHPGLQGWIATGILFGLGLINALWVARTRFLWLAVLSHAAYNGVLIVLPFVFLISRPGS
jgi:membrane protease YdiL (CAAX protease family)